MEILKSPMNGHEENEETGTLPVGKAEKARAGEEEAWWWGGGTHLSSISINT